MIEGRTLTLPPSAPSPTVFIVGVQRFTANNHGFSIAGTSPYDGGPGTPSGVKSFHLKPSTLIIGSKTYHLSLGVFTVGSEILIAIDSNVVLSSHTLLPGGQAVTVDGTAVSLDPSGDVVITSTTETLGEATAVPNLGSLIMGAFGAGPSSSDLGGQCQSSCAGSGGRRLDNATSSAIAGNATAAVPFEGAAVRIYDKVIARRPAVVLGFARMAEYV